MVNWNAHTKTYFKRTFTLMYFNCNNTTQTRLRRVRRLQMRVKTRRRILIIGKVRKTHINDG